MSKLSYFTSPSSAAQKSVVAFKKININLVKEKDCKFSTISHFQLNF